MIWFWVAMYLVFSYGVMVWIYRDTLRHDWLPVVLAPVLVPMYFLVYLAGFLSVLKGF